jgi:hypothetical protein
MTMKQHHGDRGLTKSTVRDHDRDKLCDGDEPDRVLYTIRGVEQRRCAMVENVEASGLKVQLHSHRETRKKTMMIIRALVQRALKYT